MGNVGFSDGFKRDAVAQINERGYPVSEVSQRLDVSLQSLHAWEKKFSKSATTKVSIPLQISSEPVR